MPTCSKLFVDIGRSAIKYQLATETKVISCPHHQFNISRLPQVDEIYIATVINSNYWRQTLKPYCKRLTSVVTQQSYFNLTNGYKDYRQLGVDRWLSLIAVYHLYPKQDVLLIDCGSALTFDFLSADACHLGGFIMPGPQLLKDSIATFNQPCHGISDKPQQDTYNAWHSGCCLMVADAINHRVAVAKKDFAQLAVVLSGGAILSLIKRFDFSHQCHQNLPLTGLNFWHNSQL